MAINILRKGRTPFWGTVDSTNVGLLLDSVNYSTEVKDYEQLNEVGAVKGYIIYDQTVSFDVSGTMLVCNGTNLNNSADGMECSQGLHGEWSNPMGIGNTASTATGEPASTYLEKILSYADTWNMVNETINMPTTAIIKSNSISTTAGGAATFSASGTIYDFR